MIAGAKEHLLHLKDRPILFEVVAGIQTCKGYNRLTVADTRFTGLRKERANNKLVELNTPCEGNGAGHSKAQKGTTIEHV